MRGLSNTCRCPCPKSTS